MKKPIWQVLLICAGACLPFYLGIYTLTERKKIFFNMNSGYSISHPDLNFQASLLVAAAYFIVSIIILLLLTDNRTARVLMQVLGVLGVILFMASAFVNTGKLL